MRVLGLLLVSCLLGLGGCGTHSTTPASRWYHSFTTRYNALYNAEIAFGEGYRELFSPPDQYYDYPLTTYPLLGAEGEGKNLVGLEVAEAKAKQVIRIHSLRIPPVGAVAESHTQREYNPSIHRAWLLLGQSQLFSGHRREAIETFAYIDRLFADDSVIQYRAKLWLLRALSLSEAAQEAREVALELDTIAAPLGDKLFPHLRYIAVAEYQLLVGDTITTTELLEQAALSAPLRSEQAQLYYLLGQLYTQKQDLAKAQSCWHRAKQLAPTISLELASILRGLELGEDDLVRRERALLTLAKRRRYREHRDAIYWHLGRLRHKQGDLPKAEHFWQTAVLHTTPSSSVYLDIQEALGLMYLRQGQWLLACEHYRQLAAALSLHHGHPRATAFASLQVRVDSLEHWIKIYRCSPSSDLIALKQPERYSKQPLLRPTSPASDPSVVGEAGRGYFDNPHRLQQGREIFAQQWGDRPLADRWRTSSARDPFALVRSADRSLTDSLSSSDNAAVSSPPTSSPLVSAASSQLSLDEVEEAMWRIAQILLDDFGLCSEATAVWHSMLKRFPAGRYADAVRHRLEE